MSVEKNFLVVVYTGTGRDRQQIAGKPTEEAALKHALVLAAQNPGLEIYVYRAQCFAQARLTPATIYPVTGDEVVEDEEEAPVSEADRQALV